MRSALIAAGRRLLLPLALAAFVTLLATAFAWPTSHVEPRGLPIGLAGSHHFVTTTTRELDAQAPGAFDITVAPTDADGRAMLDDNAVDGLFVEGSTGPELVLGAAGRPAVADLLTSVESRLHREAGAVTEEVAPPSDDPHSAVFTAASLPTVLGAIAVGAVLASSGRSRHDRLVGTAAVAVLSGIGLTLVLDSWLGALGGDWWALAGCYALGVGGIVAAINGLSHHFGRVGLVVVAGAVMLLGNPLSGPRRPPTCSRPDGPRSAGSSRPAPSPTRSARSPSTTTTEPAARC